MKVKITSVFLMFLLSISFTGCSDSKNAKAQMINKNSALEAYKAVLLNKTEFFDTDFKKSLYLNDLLTNTDNLKGMYKHEVLTNEEINKNPAKLTQFTIVDLDGDAIPEVVAILSEGNVPIDYEILHYMNDTVYGYLMVYTDAVKLKAGGTFCSITGEARLCFKPDAFEMNLLNSAAYKEDSNGKITSYSINDKAVSKKSFNSFVQKLAEKKDEVLYEFSQENIGTKFSVNP